MNFRNLENNTEPFQKNVTDADKAAEMKESNYEKQRTIKTEGVMNEKSITISKTQDLNTCTKVELSGIKELGEFVCKNNWSQGIFKDDHRSKENFLKAEIIALDIDNDRDEKCTLEEAKVKFTSYKHIIATSRNHQKVKNAGKSNEKPAVDRFRVILFLEKTIEDAETYTQTWIELEKRFPFIDPAAKDASRFWFMSNDVVSINDTGKLVSVVTPVLTESKVTKPQPTPKLCEITLVGAEDFPLSKDGEFNKEIINWTIDTLKNYGHGIVDDYENYIKLAMAFNSAGLAYDEVDPIFQLSSGHDYEKNKSQYEKLDPKDITFATAVHYAKECKLEIKTITCGDVVITVEPKNRILNEIQKKFMNDNYIPQDKYKETIYGNYVNPASTVGFIQRFLTGAMEHSSDIGISAVKHLFNFGIDISDGFISTYKHKKIADEYQAKFELLSNFSQDDADTITIVKEILAAQHSLKIKQRLDEESEGSFHLTQMLPLPISDEFASKLDKVKTLTGLVSILRAYCLLSEFDNQTLLSDDVLNYFFLFADEYLKTIVFEKKAGDYNPKRVELENNLVSDVRRAIKTAINSIQFETTKDWLSKVSQLDKKNLKNMLHPELFILFCSGNKKWELLKNPLEILNKMKTTPVIDCAEFLLKLHNFVLNYEDMELTMEAGKKNAELDEFNDETKSIYQQLLHDLRCFNAINDISFDIDTILNKYEQITEPSLSNLFELTLIYTSAYDEVLEACSKDSIGFNWRTFVDDAPFITSWFKVENEKLADEPIEQNLILGSMQTSATYFADRILDGNKSFKQCFIVDSEFEALSLSELLEMTQSSREEYVIFALGRNNRSFSLGNILDHIVCETMYLCETNKDDSTEYSALENAMDDTQVCWSSFNCFNKLSTIMKDETVSMRFSSILNFVKSKNDTDSSRLEVLRVLKKELHDAYEDALDPKKVMFKFWRTINRKLEFAKNPIVVPKNDLDKKTFEMVKEEVFQTLNKIGKLTYVEELKDHSFVLNNKSTDTRKFWDKTFQNLRCEYAEDYKSWFTDSDNFVENSDSKKPSIPVIMNVIKSANKVDADNDFAKVVRFLGIVKEDIMKVFLRELTANSFIGVSKIKRLNKNFAMTEINNEKVLVIGNENEEGLIITNNEVKPFINGEHGLYFKQKYPHILNYAPNLKIQGNPVGEKLQDLNFPDEVKWLYEAIAIASPFVVSFEEDLQRNIVSVIGASGTGKSTATQMFLKMIGRTDAKLHVASGSREGMIETIASSNDIVGIDEFETISPDNQSILRTLVTSGQSSKRKLYTSNDMISISFNGIMFIHAEQSKNWQAQGLVYRTLHCKPTGKIVEDKNIENIPSDTLEKIHTYLVRKWQEYICNLNANKDLPSLPFVKKRFKRFWQYLYQGLKLVYDDADEKISAMDEYFQKNQNEFMQEQDYFANGICDAFEITEGDALEFDKSYGTSSIRTILKQVIPSAKFNNRPFNSNTSLSKALEERSHNGAVNDALPTVFEEMTGIRIEQIKYPNRNMYKFVKLEDKTDTDADETKESLHKGEDYNARVDDINPIKQNKRINLENEWKKKRSQTSKESSDAS